MDLSKLEQDMLDGQKGEGVKQAMEILYALGTIYGAESMVEIKSAQIAGVSYRNLGEAGLSFLSEWAKKGAKARVPATLNPAGMDLSDWEALGFSREFAEKQLAVVRAYENMGVAPTCTCTPYLVGNKPSYGDHLAWSESSAVSYANSVLGARTNREGGPSALAAAITGRTPAYGLHLDENRVSDLLIDVSCPLESVSDFGALGCIAGKAAGNKIPYFSGFKAGLDELKSLGASMAASGAVALYHVEDLTPEARGKNMLSEDFEKITVESLEEGYSELDMDGSEIDFVAVGCPHASLEEVKRIASLLSGRKVSADFWITTSKDVKKAAEREGLKEKIESSGARLVADTCMIVAPIEELGFKHMATNAGKAAFYAPSHCKTSVRFGPLEKCVEAAVSGRWD